MSRNKLKRFFSLLSIGVFIGILPLLLSSCDLLGVSIENRIEYFIDDLNNDRPNAITNFHPTETYDRLTGAITCDPLGTCFWDADFPVGGTPYTLVSIIDTDPLNVRVTINGGPPGWGDGGSGTDEFKFVMIADGTNWLIEELWYWGGSEIVQ
jgi:hypothetical protein